MMKLLLPLAAAVFWMAVPVLGDDVAEANRLMVEAVGHMREAELASSAEGRYALLRSAHEKLLAIVESYPSTDLAVKLTTGQQIGDVSLAGVRTAMNDAMNEATQIAQQDARRDPGTPLHAWRLDAAVVALGSPPGTRLAWMVGRDGVTVLRDVGTGAVLRTWRRGSRPVAAAMSSSGERVLTAFENRNAVVLRDTTSGHVVREWEHNWPVSSVALSRDGGMALVGVRDAVLIDVVALEIRHTWGRRASPTAVALSPEGHLVAAGFADGTAVLGEAASGRTLHTWEHPGSGSGGIASIDFSADGRLVLIGAANYQAVLRATATGSILQEWNVGARVTAVALSRDGRWALTGDDDWEVELHDTQSGATVRKWRYDSWPTAVAFSPDGRQAFMGFGDGAAIICEIHVPQQSGGYERTYLSHDAGCR